MFARTLSSCDRYGENVPSFSTAGKINDGGDSRVAAIAEVKDNLRTPLPTLAKAEDFELSSAWEDLTPDRLDGILIGPDFACATVYAVDCRGHYVYFTVHDPKCTRDVYRAPFLYQAQARHAKQLLRVPTELLGACFEHRLGEDRESVCVSFIFGVPRSGTTLLSKVVEAVGNYYENDGDAAPAGRRIISLSEPDVFGELVTLRTFSGSNDDLIVDYLCILLPFLCRGPGASAVRLLGDSSKDPRTATLTTFLFKPRSQANRIMDLIQKAHGRLVSDSSRLLPSVVSMRDCLSVVKSFAKLCDGEDVRPVFGIPLKGNLEALSRQMPLLRRIYEPRDDDNDSIFVSGIAILSCLWCSDFASCREYILSDQNRTGQNALPIYYSQWTAAPRECIPAILRHLQCVASDPMEEVSSAVDPQLLDVCIAAMQKDSQEGSWMSGEAKRLLWNADHEEEVAHLLDRLGFVDWAGPEFRFDRKHEDS